MSTAATLPVTKVKVGPRFRQDLGSVDDLVESIREVGLLHPIVVDVKNNLIAGERRLQACARLGMKEVEATIVDLDEDRLLRAQRDENTVRKPFTPTEMVAIKRAVEDRVKTPHGGDHTSAASKMQSLHLAPGSTISKAAAIVGTSPETLRKAEAVVTAAEADPELAPVVDEMDATGKVEPAYRKAMEAKAEKRREVTTAPPDVETPIRLDKSRAATDERRKRIKALAGEGHTAAQIGEIIGMTRESVKASAKFAGIKLTPDAVMGTVHALDIERIIGKTVANLEAEAISLGVLPETLAVEADQAQEWAKSLAASLKTFRILLRRLES